MLSFLRSTLVASLLVGAVSAPAQANPVLVELFTSQGCSSCPPADLLLGDLKGRNDVIALSLHVDYWNYLGWEDEFSDPKYSDRQRRYARYAGASMIYTPQMVVGGQDHIVGTKAMKLRDAIDKHKSVPDHLALIVSENGDIISIVTDKTPASSVEVLVQLVYYSPEEVVNIRSGENAGRTITYHNVVRDWQVIGTWDGSAALQTVVRRTDEMPAVVILQDGASGSVLAAARVE